jgi:lipoprotein NlpD
VLRVVSFRAVLDPRIIGVILLMLLTAACGPKTRWDHTPRDQHIVRSGETLFTIAWRYGEDHRDLARWNKLGDGSLIYPGQVIRLTPPPGEQRASSYPSPPRAVSRPLPPLPSLPAPQWSWPASGRVAVEFGGRPGTGTGMLIDGAAGSPITASAAGTVVYSGSGLIGYGELIIIKHNDTYLSAYGHNASLLVKEGQRIKKGQKIATMGKGPGGKPRLHFEIRRNGKPVDPRKYLPAR